MKHEWILVANASLARLFSRETDSDPLVPLHTYEHPQSRLKASALADDHLGHGSADLRPGGISFSPRMSPQRKQHLLFAHELAQRLERGLATGECDRITLYASCPFVGELKGQLSPHAKKALRAAVDLDLTSYGLGELEERIAHALQTLETEQRV